MLGFNYRMTEIQAALGMSQLQRLDSYVERRNELARRYDLRAARLAFAVTRASSPRTCAPFISTWFASRPAQRPRRIGRSSTTCGSMGIGVNLHYMPVHLQPYYRALGFAAGQYPEAEAHGARPSRCRCSPD